MRRILFSSLQAAVPEQGVDILTDVVIARAVPEVLRARFVMIERYGGDFFELVGSKLHAVNRRAGARFITPRAFRAP